MARALFTFNGKNMITYWVIFLIFYAYWLMRRRPYSVVKYRFIKSRFTLQVEPFKRNKATVIYYKKVNRENKSRR